MLLRASGFLFVSGERKKERNIFKSLKMFFFFSFSETGSASQAPPLAGSGGDENRCLAFPQWVSALGNGTPILRWDRNAWEPSPAFRICFGAEEKTLPLPQHDETRASLRRGFFCTEKGALNSSSRRPQSLEIFIEKPHNAARSASDAKRERRTRRTSQRHCLARGGRTRRDLDLPSKYSIRPTIQATRLPTRISWKSASDKTKPPNG
jgi:hypothetical protein